MNLSQLQNQYSLHKMKYLMLSQRFCPERTVMRMKTLNYVFYTSTICKTSKTTYYQIRKQPIRYIVVKPVLKLIGKVKVPIIIPVKSFVTHVDKHASPKITPWAK